MYLLFMGFQFESMTLHYVRLVLQFLIYTSIKVQDRIGLNINQYNDHKSHGQIEFPDK